jgi:hypothetical protein
MKLEDYLHLPMSPQSDCNRGSQDYEMTVGSGSGTALDCCCYIPCTILRRTMSQRDPNWRKKLPLALYSLKKDDQPCTLFVLHVQTKCSRRTVVNVGPKLPRPELPGFGPATSTG